MKKIIGFTAVAFLACALFAEETSQMSWQKGKSANEARKTFYSSVSQYKTEAEREAAFKAAGIGGGGQYSDQEHLDVETFLARGLITQEQADKIKADAKVKHEGISAAYQKADFENMTKAQISDFYKNLKADKQ